MSRSKRIGSAWEVAVRDYMTERGLPVVRLATAGNKDTGDLFGIPNTVLELKATKAIDLAAARKEAAQEAINAGVDYFASIHKKRQANVRDAYVEMPLWAYCDLLLAMRGRSGPHISLQGGK